MQNTNYLIWVEFYQEFATKLLPYAKDRSTLIDKIKNVFESIDMKLPTLEKENNIIDIDPFTVFGLFNKGITIANRIKIIRAIAKEFVVTTTVPENFDGIPVLNNQAATLYYFVDSRDEHDIDYLWDLFVAALQYTDKPAEENKEKFIQCFDQAIRIKGIKWNITMVLYWVRPYAFISLDSRNREILCDTEYMPSSFVNDLDGLKLMPTGQQYLQICEASKQLLLTAAYSYENFPELSYYAWKTTEKAKVTSNKQVAHNQSKRESTGEAVADKNVTTVHYWMYSPGVGASKWDEFYNDNIMAIRWGEIGDLKEFGSKDEIKTVMKDCYGSSYFYTNAAYVTWQFANEMKPGDIVFVKKGMHLVLGRGVVTSEYKYDDERTDNCNHVRNINWTHIGEWSNPGYADKKTLSDITAYSNYVEYLNALFEEDMAEDVEEEEIIYPSYTSKEFLDDVYMSEENHEIITNLLRNKKNIILQGAPGVGKTYAAKRLAYSMMGEKDPNRVKMIQFHQSYSYEDFIMGFRPSASGFELKKGPFYYFCKKAEIDSENEYFFIIDEINRGNLSKIFGELFMLIENDKRGVALQLLYSDESFSIPDNVYLIGMMNTADRSLAMLDYALRRRFAFFEFAPAFETEGFKKYQTEKNSKKFDGLILTVEQLNNVIENDETLGRGFRIGHSYFCTEKAIDDMWLNSVVTYELIPLLNEYWFDEPSKVKDWEQKLREAIK